MQTGGGRGKLRHYRLGGLAEYRFVWVRTEGLRSQQADDPTVWEARPSRLLWKSSGSRSKQTTLSFGRLTRWRLRNRNSISYNNHNGSITNTTARNTLPAATSQLSRSGVDGNRREIPDAAPYSALFHLFDYVPLTSLYRWILSRFKRSQRADLNNACAAAEILAQAELSESERFEAETERNTLLRGSSAAPGDLLRAVSEPEGKIAELLIAADEPQ